MPTYDGGSSIDDDNDVELLEARHKRRTRVDSPKDKDNQSDLLNESQTQAEPSQKHLFREALDKVPSKTLAKKYTDEGTNAAIKLDSEDVVMTDTIAELNEKGFVKLPSLRRLLPEKYYTPQLEENIARPFYNEYYHHEGFVAWWDNKTGKGMIVDHRNNIEHKIGTYISELKLRIWYGI